MKKSAIALFASTLVLLLRAGAITDFSWDFGDGATASSPRPGPETGNDTVAHRNRNLRSGRNLNQEFVLNPATLIYAELV